MGRPGGAGDGRSGGGHSSSRSGGGHRVSGGRPGGGRPTGGYSGSSGRRPPGGGSYSRNPPPPMRNTPPRPPQRNNGDFWKGALVGSMVSDLKNSSGRTNSGEPHSGNQQGHPPGSTNSCNAKAENVNAEPGHVASGASGVQDGNVNADSRNSTTPPAEPKIPKWQIAIVLVLAVCAVLFGVFGSSEGSSREKLTGVSAYDADCIVDEEYWFDSPAEAGKELNERKADRFSHQEPTPMRQADLSYGSGM